MLAVLHWRCVQVRLDGLLPRTNCVAADKAPGKRAGTETS
jgi:hypothetical protein